MKINEILQEGIVDFAKKIGGAVSAAKTGYQTAQVSKQQAARTNKVAAGALQKWTEINQNIVASGQQSTPAQAVQWFTTFSGKPPTKSPANTSPVTMKQWVTSEINNFMAIRALGNAPETAPVAAQKSEPLMSTPAGVEIVSPDPLVLRYRNADYVQNNQGQWTKFNSSSALAPTEQAFFDKQMDILHPATPE